MLFLFYLLIHRRDIPAMTRVERLHHMGKAMEAIKGTIKGTMHRPRQVWLSMLTILYVYTVQGHSLPKAFPIGSSGYGQGSQQGYGGYENQNQSPYNQESYGNPGQQKDLSGR